ncbi:MAG: hypothetical protein ACREE6_06840, partial [Limisphaerales bacterium]
CVAAVMSPLELADVFPGTTEVLLPASQAAGQGHEMVGIKRPCSHITQKADPFLLDSPMRPLVSNMRN